MNLSEGLKLYRATIYELDELNATMDMYESGMYGTKSQGFDPMPRSGEISNPTQDQAIGNITLRSKIVHLQFIKLQKQITAVSILDGLYNSRLNETYKRVLITRYIKGRSINHTAAVLQISKEDVILYSKRAMAKAKGIKID